MESLYRLVELLLNLGASQVFYVRLPRHSETKNIQKKEGTGRMACQSERKAVKGGEGHRKSFELSRNLEFYPFFESMK